MNESSVAKLRAVNADNGNREVTNLCDAYLALLAAARSAVRSARGRSGGAVYMIARREFRMLLTTVEILETQR